MDNLRLILLIVGIAVIAIIYFWDTIKRKKQTRQQTIHEPDPGLDLPEFRINPQPSIEEDYSVAASELSTRLSQEKTVDSEYEQEEKEITPGAREQHELDMFEKETTDTESGKGKNATDDIVMLHITALPTRPFNGQALLDAVDLVGLEYGDMQIFHHYGVGDMRSERALFSLANMYEPGNFDLNTIGEESIKGLTLFLCLPTTVDGHIVFELMLNTAQRLADVLGGEVRGPGHKLLNDFDIGELRGKISGFLSD